MPNPFLNVSTVVDGDPVSVFDLLSDTHVIPTYQRDFVWQARQVGQLWDDLIEYHNRLASQARTSQPPGYFLGAMVVVEGDEQEGPQVVDGQQRLTTLSTIVATLRESLDALPEDDPVRELSSTLRELLYAFDGEVYRTNLVFSDSDLREFYVACVVKRTFAERTAVWTIPKWATRLRRKDSSIARLKEAFEIGHFKLTEFLNSEQNMSLRLKTLVQVFIFSVVVLKIRCHSYESAWEIFESLNNRNVQLSQADLVKNLILRIGTDEDNRRRINDNWNDAKDFVHEIERPKISLPDALHYSELSRYGVVKAKGLFTSIKGRLRVDNAAEAAVHYSANFLEDSKALNALTTKFEANWTAATVDMLSDISDVLGTKLVYPYLTAVYREHHSTPDVMETHVRLAMNFAFRFITVGDGSLEEFARHVTAAAALVKQGSSPQDVSELFHAQSPDGRFKDEFAQLGVSNAKLGYFCCYYIEKALLQAGGVAPLQHGGHQQDLEHIMPKSPTEEMWPEGFVLKRSDKDEFKRYLWRVGNLLALPAGINRAAQNDGIADKIAAYQDSHLVLPNSLQQFLVDEHWTIKSIERRQAYLADTYVCKAWTLSVDG